MNNTDSYINRTLNRASKYDIFVYLTGILWGFRCIYILFHPSSWGNPRDRNDRKSNHLGRKGRNEWLVFEEFPNTCTLKIPSTISHNEQKLLRSLWQIKLYRLSIYISYFLNFPLTCFLTRPLTTIDQSINYNKNCYNAFHQTDNCHIASYHNRHDRDKPKIIKLYGYVLLIHWARIIKDKEQRLGFPEWG